MKVLFEGVRYKKEQIDLLLDSKYYTSLDNGDVEVLYVGYCFSQSCQDTVFILPKVFVTNGQAFGDIDPCRLIDLSNNADISDTEHKHKGFIFQLSIWIYQAINHYYKRICKLPSNHNTDTLNELIITNASQTAETYIDCVLKLLNYSKTHDNLHIYLKRNCNKSVGKINWSKTIAKTYPFIKFDNAFFITPIIKRKAISFDEQLIILYYSLLNYLKSKYKFYIKQISADIELIKPPSIQNLIDSGKGTKLLRSIRNQYFTDELVELWNIMYSFFLKSESSKYGKAIYDAALTKNFESVYEDMVEQMIGDDACPIDMKYQRDGKIIDHIYKDKSLFGEGKIFFIGDSKYYKDDNSIDKHSVYKQFTYAKNVIQYYFDHKSDESMSDIRYRDSLTEGYNITPNFFIRADVDFETLDYSLLSLKCDKKQSYISTQFSDRLFDRDTLIVQTYQINFLFLLSSYVSDLHDESLKKSIRTRFRDDIITSFNDQYDFFKVTPLISVEEFVSKHFREYLGKMYRESDKSNYIWFAFEKKNKSEYHKLYDAFCNEANIQQIKIS